MSNKTDLDIFLRAYDETGPAINSAVENVRRYAQETQAASDIIEAGSAASFGATAVSATIAAAKIALVGGAVAGVAYLVYKNFDTIKSVVGQAVSAVTGAVSGFVDWVAS